MSTHFYFRVEFPEADFAMTWCGGGLRRSKDPNKVWLTTPGGTPVLEVYRRMVRPITRDEAAAALAGREEADASRN
jgi:hypothetical protein